MIADEHSRRRLFREDDYVRHEIATALSRNIPRFQSWCGREDAVR